MILGVDPGERRYGIALADDDVRWAHPLTVVDARSDDPIERIAALCDEHQVTTIVVGRPVSLSGRAGPAAAKSADFAARLRARVAAPVVEFDERLSTVAAERGLRSAGASPARRRRVVDAVAAQVMLQQFLDASR